MWTNTTWAQREDNRSKPISNTGEHDHSTEACTQVESWWRQIRLRRMTIHQIYLFDAFEGLGPSHPALKTLSCSFSILCLWSSQIISRSDAQKALTSNQRADFPRDRKMIIVPPLQEAGVCCPRPVWVCVCVWVGGCDACESSNVCYLRGFCCVSAHAGEIQVVLLYIGKGQVFWFISSRPHTSQHTQCQSQSDILNIYICLCSYRSCPLQKQPWTCIRKENPWTLQKILISADVRQYFSIHIHQKGMEERGRALDKERYPSFLVIFIKVFTVLIIPSAWAYTSGSLLINL